MGSILGLVRTRPPCWVDVPEDGFARGPSSRGVRTGLWRMELDSELAHVCGVSAAPAISLHAEEGST